MSITSGRGDTGFSNLIGGERRSKHDTIFEAIGAIDELSSFIGLAQSMIQPSLYAEHMTSIQNNLFLMSAGLAKGKDKLPADATLELESWMATAEQLLPPLTNFVYPGGTTPAATIHVARAVARRAERLVWRLYSDEMQDDLEKEAAVYLNRLSDYLFVVARSFNIAASQEQLWIKGK